MTTALDNLTAGNADAYIKAISTASTGTISNMDAMTASARALKLGVVGSADEMAHLTEVAGIMGRAMGEDATSALNDLVTGIGRASPMILDNLGIVTKQADLQEAVNQLMAENAGLTQAAAQKQALLNVVLAQGDAMLAQAGGTTNDAASELERFDALVKNTKDDLGQFLVHGLLPWVEGIRAVHEAHQDVRQQIAATPD